MDKKPAKPILNKVLIANDSLSVFDIAINKASRIEHYIVADLDVSEVF